MAAPHQHAVGAAVQERHRSSSPGPSCATAPATSSTACRSPATWFPRSMWQPLSANLLKVYTGIPGFASLPAAPNPGYVRYFYNNPSRLLKNQDLLRVDYAISSKMNTLLPLGERLPEGNRTRTASGPARAFPIQPQSARSRAVPGHGTSSPRSRPQSGRRDDPVLQSPVAVALDCRDNPLDRDKLGANLDPALSADQPDQLGSGCERISD